MFWLKCKIFVEKFVNKISMFDFIRWMGCYKVICNVCFLFFCEIFIYRSFVEEFV